MKTLSGDDRSFNVSGAAPFIISILAILNLFLFLAIFSICASSFSMAKTLSPGHNLATSIETEPEPAPMSQNIPFPGSLNL